MRRNKKRKKGIRESQEKEKVERKMRKNEEEKDTSLGRKKIRKRKTRNRKD